MTWNTPLSMYLQCVSCKYELCRKPLQSNQSQIIIPKTPIAVKANWHSNTTLLFRRHEHSNVIFLNIHREPYKNLNILKVNCTITWYSIFQKLFIKLVAALLHLPSIKQCLMDKHNLQMILNMRKERKKKQHSIIGNFTENAGPGAGMDTAS